MAAGEMVELVAARNDINTSDNLNIFEGYQKVFVVNGENLKVADFVNTKLTCSARTQPPAHGDVLTQAQTGGNAYMVVDFVNTAMTAIYGFAYYDGTATAFNTTNTVSSNNAIATMSGATFIPATVTPKPNWYDWTVYPDIVLSEDNYGQEAGATKSFGTMPEKAYIGCLYRGRTVLSGNPRYPYQWYMARQNNPWDWAYLANDSQAPVAGQDADAGQSGDIVRALIPYRDDYLIIGCSTSMWIMAGDPAIGGSLNAMDMTVGIFGPNSWCFDGEGNLYFWGTNGIYKTNVPGTPKCISEVALPSLVEDETADPATYRITMAYDRVRSGIVICITKLADGTNSNWWLDLRTQGFFHELYPDECGAYSSFFYPSGNETQQGLLLGCKDGYIRVFDDDTVNDNVGPLDEAISSHIVFGPLKLGKDYGDEGVISGLNLTLAGGSSGGSKADSDDVTFNVFSALSAENIMEQLDAGSSPRISGIVSITSQRGGISRQTVRGVYAGIKIENNNKDETWGMESISFNIKQGKR